MRSRASSGFFSSRNGVKRASPDILSIGSLEGHRVNMSQRKERPELFSPRISTAGVEKIQKKSQAWGSTSVDNGNIFKTFQSSIVEENSNFGIKSYVAPRGELARLPIPNIASPNYKTPKSCFIDEVIKKKSVIPPPDKYIKNVVWCELAGSDQKKGVFLKDVRNTPADVIFMNEKKKPMPSPDKYQNLEAWRK